MEWKIISLIEILSFGTLFFPFPSAKQNWLIYLHSLCFCYFWKLWWELNKCLLIKYVILLPSHLAIELLRSLLFTRRIIYINLNITEVEIISDTNKCSGDRHKKRLLRCLSLFPIPAHLCIQCPVRGDSSWPFRCRDALVLQLISNSKNSCKGVNFGNHFLLRHFMLSRYQK